MVERMIRKTVQKARMSDVKSDVSYWRTKSYAERLAALEEIRREYNNWRYSDAELRFQRVYRIVKLK